VGEAVAGHQFAACLRRLCDGPLGSPEKPHVHDPEDVCGGALLGASNTRYVRAWCPAESAHVPVGQDQVRRDDPRIRPGGDGAASPELRIVRMATMTKARSTSPSTNTPR
jgi:hypothetical protein